MREIGFTAGNLTIISKGHNSLVGELVNLTHCLSSPWPGNDISVGELVNLTHCLSSPWPGHDSLVGELVNLTVCPFRGRVTISQWEN